MNTLHKTLLIAGATMLLAGCTLTQNGPSITTQDEVMQEDAGTSSSSTPAPTPSPISTKDDPSTLQTELNQTTIESDFGALVE